MGTGSQQGSEASFEDAASSNFDDRGREAASDTVAPTVVAADAVAADAVAADAVAADAVVADEVAADAVVADAVVADEVEADVVDGDAVNVSTVNIRNLSIKCGHCETYQTLSHFHRQGEWNVYTYECENDQCDPAVTRTYLEVPVELDEFANRDPNWHGGKVHAGADH